MYEFLQNLGGNIVNGISRMFTWLGNFINDLWNGFKTFIALIFQPILIFFQGIWYLITKCFDMVVLSVQVVFGLFKVVLSVIAGIFHTFAGLLGFSGNTDYYYMPAAYQQGYDGVSNFLRQTGLSTIALILMVFVWIMTAYALIRIAGGQR
ncbi:hypothetical protein Psfp_02349 [Pelotomaculum sp. FP]|uniref:hypothetical protein n=1 Tax=Pelotomaculum sp. FP TaxID=261474 RepID=UPI00106650DB|nr:hypothetical protein [Pelotomaculum sp. FP]TEB15173.1 hypothetical protein Psfp_02349 [Pelotomaculum sp. FP]